MLLTTQFAPQEYGVATKKSNVELAAQVDDAIAAMQADGTLDELYARWGLSEDGVSNGAAVAQGGGSHV